MVQIKEAGLADIPEMQRIRHAVKENTLSDPALVPDQAVAEYILERGRGWVALAGDQAAGFAIVSSKDHNVWALFVDPEWERKGIGRMLHDAMMDWYFNTNNGPIWLSTSPGTRAEGFYETAGWTRTGLTSGGEVRFEMSRAGWIKLKS